MHLKLRRNASGPHGTFGLLSYEERPICLTLEDPPNNNSVGNSCINPGTYNCLPHNGKNFKDVWILQNVPGRSAILIHNGNTIQDTRGCILVGLSIGTIEGQPAILNSLAALNLLRKTLPTNFTLTIE
jgi:hypothetical protein